MPQLYNHGDHIRVHGGDAIILNSYAEKFGGAGFDHYAVHMRNGGWMAWVYDIEIELIERARIDLLELWKSELDADIVQKSDLDWIFNNGPTVAAFPSQPSLQALASTFGMVSLWGENGEGVTLHRNCQMTWLLTARFLLNKDPKGWMVRAAEIKKWLSLPPSQKHSIITPEDYCAFMSCTQTHAICEEVSRFHRGMADRDPRMPAGYASESDYQSLNRARRFAETTSPSPIVTAASLSSDEMHDPEPEP